MTGIRVYVEGDRKLRPGFHEFFKEVRKKAEERSIRFRCIPCGAEPVRDFCIALRTNPENLNILLVDSEGPVNGALARLKQRSDWKPPKDVTPAPDQIHWMVQVMESWFLADRKALRECYGSRLNEAALPGDPCHVEEIPKRDVLDGLKRSTDGRYHKTGHAPKVLALLTPEVVCSAAPGCQRLFDTLLAKLAD